VAVDGPEEVIEADDYLQPTPRASVEIPTTPVSSKVRSTSYFFFFVQEPVLSTSVNI
jgi:hypothetical protein